MPPREVPHAWQPSKHRSRPDYIDRTIATVRQHRGADNCWPQWANIFADEIEDLRADVARLDAEFVSAGRRLAETQALLDAHRHEFLKEFEEHGFGSDDEAQLCLRDFETTALADSAAEEER